MLIPESKRSELRQRFDLSSQGPRQTPAAYAKELSLLVDVLSPAITEAMAVDKFVDTCAQNAHVFYQLQSHRAFQGDRFKTLTEAAEAAAQAASANITLEQVRKKLAVQRPSTPEEDPKGLTNPTGMKRRFTSDEGGAKPGGETWKGQKVVI